MMVAFFGYDYYWQSTRATLWSTTENWECSNKRMSCVSRDEHIQSHADKVKHGNFDKWSFGAFTNTNTNNSCSSKGGYGERVDISGEWERIYSWSCFGGLFVCRAVGFVCVSPILTAAKQSFGVWMKHFEWHSKEHIHTHILWVNHPSEQLHCPRLGCLRRRWTVGTRELLLLQLCVWRRMLNGVWS